MAAVCKVPTARSMFSTSSNLHELQAHLFKGASLHARLGCGTEVILCQVGRALDLASQEAATQRAARGDSTEI